MKPYIEKLRVGEELKLLLFYRWSFQSKSERRGIVGRVTRACKSCLGLFRTKSTVV